MKKFINTAIALFVLWNYDPVWTDTLEFQEYIGGPWIEVPAPYFFSPDGADYKIEIIPLSPQMIFRVRREWTP